MAVEWWVRRREKRLRRVKIETVYPLQNGAYRFECLILAPDFSFADQIFDIIDDLRTTVAGTVIVYFDQAQKELVLKSKIVSHVRVALAIRVNQTLEIYSSRPSHACNRTSLGPSDLSAICDVNGLQTFRDLTEELNFNGCKLKVGAVLYEPNVIGPPDFTSDLLFKPLKNLSGVEVQLLNLIADTLNFSIEFYTFHETELWGAIYSQTNFTGMFKMLANRSVDVLIGGLYVTLPRTQLFDISNPYRFVLSFYRPP